MMRFARWQTRLCVDCNAVMRWRILVPPIYPLQKLAPRYRRCWLCAWAYWNRGQAWRDARLRLKLKAFNDEVERRMAELEDGVMLQ